MKLRYRAIDRSGAGRVAVMEAPSAAEATESLRREGLFVVEMAEADGGAPRAPGRGGGGGKRVRRLAGFARQMAVLVSTGTRIADALVALERQTRDVAWRAVIADVRRRVEEGAPLGEALAAHPGSFGPVAISLVRAGESSGRLDVMLQRLAEVALQELRLRQQVTGALVYPLVLIVLSVGVVLTMMLFVLPRFSGLFESLGVPLPTTTRVLLSASGALRAYWYAIVPGALGSAAALWWWSRTPGGRRTLGDLMLRVPAVGRLTRSFATARLARMLGMLQEAKVPLLESLELTAEAVGHERFRTLLARAQEAVQRGESLSVCLAEDGLVDGPVIEALRNAERTGQIGPVLSQMAEFLEEENRASLKAVTGLVEPAILVTLGVVVGLIATSIFTPLFDLTAAGGGGAP